MKTYKLTVGLHHMNTSNGWQSAFTSQWASVENPQIPELLIIKESKSFRPETPGSLVHYQHPIWFRIEQDICLDSALDGSPSDAMMKTHYHGVHTIPKHSPRHRTYQMGDVIYEVTIEFGEKTL